MPQSGDRIDEKRLADLTARCSDPAAREQLVRLCRPLAERLARRFAGRGEAHEDLVQVATVGLIKAIDNFDAERGDSLLPYATAVIIGELKHHFRDRASTVRMPRSVRAYERLVYDAVERLTQRVGRSPTVAEIASEAALDVERVLEVYTAGYVARPRSIDAIADVSGEPPVVDRHQEDEQAFLDEWMTVSPAIALLPEQQKRILYLRFYREWSQSEVAADLGISQVHVSRLLSKALTRLRASVD